jgi:hypothetical protein
MTMFDYYLHMYNIVWIHPWLYYCIYDSSSSPLPSLYTDHHGSDTCFKEEEKAKYQKLYPYTV